MKGNVIVGQSGGPTAAINASLAGVYRTAKDRGANKVYGMLHGIQGLLKEKYIDLSDHIKTELDAELLKRTPAAFLGSCRYKLPEIHENREVYDKIFEILDKLDIEAFIYIGGNDSMDTIKKLSDYAIVFGHSIRFIGCPKTIDNDLALTDHTPGYGSAAKYIGTSMKEIIRDSFCLEYEKGVVSIVEIMGRNAGWIALESGIAGSADVILLPEIPYDINKIAAKVKEREEQGRNFTIIVVAEGAKPKDGDVVVSKIVADSPDPIRLGGIGNKLADDLEKLIKEHEVRCTVLGHVQRGGNTSTYDRILSTRYGVAAVELMMEGKFGRMVCLKGDTITSDTLENVIGQNTKKVNPEGELVQVAKKIGISFAE